jgi:hypothetical protein
VNPLPLPQGEPFATVDISRRPSTYWAQAVLIYWWDQIAVNLTQANINNYHSTLQSVLLQGISLCGPN